MVNFLGACAVYIIVFLARHRFAGVAAASCVSSVALAVSAFAQSNNQPRHADASAAVSLVADRTGTHVLRPYVRADANTSWSVRLPPNLTISPTFQHIVESMVRRSSTFRRQCLRIASASRLTAVLQSFWPRETERVRGRTRLFTTPDGGLHAVVEIKPLEDHAELIAHEIEHVIEQLDGIDLRALATLPTSGVSSCESGSFETIRAIRVGRAVAEEVRRAGA
jgi:hypothetical protein